MLGTVALNTAPARHLYPLQKSTRPRNWRLTTEPTPAPEQNLPSCQNCLFILSLRLKVPIIASIFLNSNDIRNPQQIYNKPKERTTQRMPQLQNTPRLRLTPSLSYPTNDPVEISESNSQSPNEYVLFVEIVSHDHVT